MTDHYDAVARVLLGTNRERHEFRSCRCRALSPSGITKSGPPRSWSCHTSRSGDLKATTLEPPAEASAEAALQFRAPKAVMQRGFNVCAKRYNLVVLPGALLGERGHLVYALAATLQPNEVVVGGHHRFIVSEDGGTVLKEQPLSNGCMTLERSEKNVDWIMVGILTPLPNESHFFVSLLHRTPVFISAAGRLWEIDPGGFGKRKE